MLIQNCTNFKTRRTFIRKVKKDAVLGLCKAVVVHLRYMYQNVHIIETSNRIVQVAYNEGTENDLTLEAGQGIPRILLNHPKFNGHVHKIEPLDHILNYLSPFDTFTLYFFNINFSIIPPSMLRSPRSSE